MFRGECKVRVIGITGGSAAENPPAARIMPLPSREAKMVMRTFCKKGYAREHQPFRELTEGYIEILTSKETLKRRKLAEIVFGDPEKGRLVNSITHKHISDEICKKLERYKSRGNIEFAVLDVALPVKQGFLEYCDEVWTVTAAKSTRIARIMKRSALTAEEAEARIKSQPSEDEYIKIADKVIENNGTVEELERKVAKLFMQLKTG